jgi:hypothetical protein
MSPFWSSSIAILFPFVLIQTSHLISPLIPFFISIYYLSILVEVLLRLLTYRADLVLLYLVSEHYS